MHRFNQIIKKHWVPHQECAKQTNKHTNVNKQNTEKYNTYTRIETDLLQEQWLASIQSFEQEQHSPSFRTVYNPR